MLSWLFGREESRSRFVLAAFCVISIFHQFAINSFGSLQYYFYDDVDWIIEKADAPIQSEASNTEKIINQ